MNINISIDPLDIFKSELDCITSDLHYEIFVRCCPFIPKYIWQVPASSSGKYHPQDSLGYTGLLRHIKAVFWVGEELLPHRLYAPFDEETKNDIRVAELLHDMVKQGIEDTGSHTVPTHPLLVREHLKPWKGIEENEVNEDMVKAWDRICKLIETHMGIWTTDKSGNKILDEPSTEAQKFVHLTDYIASRKTIHVQINERAPQSDYKSKAEPKNDWKSNPASDKQKDYIRILMAECHAKNISVEIPTIDDLRSGEAGATIENLKKVLGK